jgi:hypothetical protein
MNEKSYLASMDGVANPSLWFVIYTTFTNSERENYRKYSSFFPNPAGPDANLTLPPTNLQQ